MSTEPFLGQLLLTPWNRIPTGWAPCNGQFLPINQNQALFALLGTAYGGNGQTTFALPDLRGRVPMHLDPSDNTLRNGAQRGAEVHTLSAAEMPAHVHTMNGTSSAATAISPAGALLATTDSTTFGPLYGAPTAPAPMGAAAVSNVGGSQPHENRQPYLVMQWLIALVGIFPTPT